MASPTFHQSRLHLYEDYPEFLKWFKAQGCNCVRLVIWAMTSDGHILRFPLAHAHSRIGLSLCRTLLTRCEGQSDVFAD